MNTENLLVRNIFLNLLTVTFVAEADEILSLLLIGPKTRQRADELVKKIIREDLANKTITTFEFYYWPRVLALLPVAFSIAYIFQQNKDLSLIFPSQKAPCFNIVLFLLICTGGVMPYLTDLVDFVFNQYMKVDESINLKERYIVVTKDLTCRLYASQLTLFTILSGTYFYEKSAMVYFQTEFHLIITGEKYLFVPVLGIVFMHFLLGRISLTNTKNWAVYSVLFLSSSLWVYFIVYIPYYLDRFYSDTVSTLE